MNLIRWIGAWPRRWCMGLLDWLNRAKHRSQRRVVELCWEADFTLERLRWNTPDARRHGTRLYMRSDFYAACALLARGCGFIVCRFWVWYDGLWIRKKESHPSFDINASLLTWMSARECRTYLADVLRRRHDKLSHKK